MAAVFARSFNRLGRKIPFQHWLLGRQQSQSSARDYSLSYEDEQGRVWRLLRQNSNKLADIDYLCTVSHGEHDYVCKNIREWLSDPNFYGMAAELNGRIVHISMVLAQDNNQTVLVFGARTLPELQRKGLLSTLLAASKILGQPYLPGVKRIRAVINVARPGSETVLQRVGFKLVSSFHAGLYSHHNSTPTGNITGDLRLGNTVQPLTIPSDGNLTSMRLYEESSDQMEVVDSALIPSGMLFEETFVHSATTANLSMLMKQYHFYGSFDGGNKLSALSYGGVSFRSASPTWWCTISALDSDKVEDVVKVNCRSALECAGRGGSGSTVNLVCYFTDINTRNVADAVLSQIGFHACDSLPGHEDLSHILVYELAM